MFLKYISMPIFLVSFAIGLFFIYIYPSPENIDKVLFKDKADNCFAFEEVFVKCPKDETQISTIPLQV